MKKIVFAVFGVAIASVTLWASTAFACTNLATLNLSTPSGVAGSSLTVTGSSFHFVKEGAPQPVQFHWNTRDGVVLGQATADAAGSVSATFNIPEGTPGRYTIIARQLNEKGTDQYGTPALASFVVEPAGGASVAAPSSPPASNLIAAGSSSNSGMIALTVGVGVIGLIMFGFGFGSVVRQTRTKETPATAPISNG